jgi:diadenosine tetraphosphate (Ap4A) HIT family hydrolase
MRVSNAIELFDNLNHIVLIKIMAIIYETENFLLESHETPEIDRLEGGHMKISPKVPVEDRACLTQRQAIELMRLTIASGEALKAAMAEIGVDIGRINYQDNGNWKPSLHVHLYGRAKTAVLQPYGEPFIPGHKDTYAALNEDDIRRIHDALTRLFNDGRYSDASWGLSN